MLLFYVAILNRTNELMPNTSQQAALGQPVDYTGHFPEPTKTILLDVILGNN